MDIQVTSPAFDKSKSNKTGAGCLALFGLPFALVGLFVLGWTGKNAYEYFDMQSWTPVDAIVTGAELESHTGDDSTTYEAVGTYKYTFEGNEYIGNRVSISSGADNIGTYQQDSAEKLKSHLSSKEPITIYVNPKDPKSSIVFRELRSGQFALMGIFGLVFFGAGFGLIFGSYWFSKDQKVREALKKKYPGQSWRANPKWQSSTLTCANKGQFLGLLFFGGLWNLISTPLLIFLPEEVFKKGNYLAALGFLFPLIGVLFLVGIYRSFIQWRKFGRTSLTLSPFPGELQNQLKGTLKISAQLQSGTKDAKGVVKCSRTEKRATTKGGTESRAVEIYKKEFPLVIETFRTSAQGTNATFTVDLPEESVVPPTDEEAYEPIKWELEFTADIPGVDFFATFEIPVVKRVV